MNKYLIFILLVCSPQLVKSQIVRKVIPPKNYVYVDIALWPFGADFAHDNSTDVYFPDKHHGMEATHFEVNLGYTVFAGLNLQPSVQNIEEGHRGTAQIYLQTDKWFNVQSIPDYYETTWTAAGASVFANAVIGQSKNTRTPNHGLEMFNISNGEYGFNGVTDGTTGTLEFNTLLFNQKVNVFGKETSASFRNGQRGSDIIIQDKKLLASTRQSLTSLDLSNLLFSTDIADIYDKPNTTRLFNDFSGSIWGFRNEPLTAQITSDYLASIQQVALAGGFHNNFTHWHWLPDFGLDLSDSYNTVMNSVRTQIDNNNQFVYSEGYGEITEYIWLRNYTVAIGYLQQDTVFLENTASPLIPSLNDFSQNLTVVYEESQGWSDIECEGCVGIRKVGTTYYVVFPINSVVKLYQSNNVNYLDFSPPTVISKSIVGQTLIVTFDKPCKVSVFYNDVGQSIYGTTYVPVRSNDTKITHAIDLSDIGVLANFDLYIGAITEVEKVSSLEQY